MGIFLEKIEIANYRGLENYSSEGFSNWSSLTGPNSSGKSTVINALALLGSNRMHDISDIPAYYKPTKVPLREISIEISYTFRIPTGLLDILSDGRILENLILSYEDSLKGRRVSKDDFFENKVKMEINLLKKNR
jgi:predicted ATP-dependent endonuclease of OLD family